MLTKGNYEQIAAIVRHVALTEKMLPQQEGDFPTWKLDGETLVKKLAQYMGHDNPNFSWEKFIEACAPKFIHRMVDDALVREPLRYGNVDLSIQASEIHFCSPRVNGLPLGDYTTVEIALMDVNYKTVVTPAGSWSIGTNPLHGERTKLLFPSDLGIDGYDHLFKDGTNGINGVTRTVGSYVSWPDVRRLAALLEQRAVSKNKGGK
jgi:hypothetical protein